MQGYCSESGYFCGVKTDRVRITTDEGAEVEALAPMIVSASRATDIPAFYADWFFSRLERGYCVWRNPFSDQISYVSFQKTRFIVFWTKNPKPLIPFLPRFKEKGIHCYVQFTLNDYEAEALEPGVPALIDRIATFKELSKLLGKQAVIWRFDPLILTEEIGIDDLLRRIEGLATELKNYTEKLVFSFADIGNYAKVKRNLASNGIKYREWTENQMREFASRLSIMNKELGWNLQLTTCAERIDLQEFGIEHNRCIDDELIARIGWQDKELMGKLGMEIFPIGDSLFGKEAIPEEAILLEDGRYALRTKPNRASGQRKFCGCAESKDIGQYDTCPHGCLYCYANTSPQIARVNYARHRQTQSAASKDFICRY